MSEINDDIKHQKLPTEAKKENSFDNNNQFRSNKLKVVSSKGLKPTLINTNANSSNIIENKNTIDLAIDNIKQRGSELFNFHDVVLSKENIQKEIGEDSMLNSQPSRIYIMLTRLLYSSKCIKIYIVFISLSIVILLYSIIGYFFHVGIINKN